ncbi:MAG: S8 family serine peptidase [Caldilineaceae bacterium]
MQPAAHGHKRILAIMTTAAGIIVTATLVITLRAAAATPTQNSQANSSSLAESTVIMPLHLDPGSTAADKGDLGNSADGRDNKNKVTGYVWRTPSEGFTGTWYVVEAGIMVTVVVTADTRLDNFVNGRVPDRYEWVEAKGKPQDDGTFLARKLRPNRFEPGEVVARLTATTTLTDVLTTYSTYSLALLDTQLADARIYRFAIAEDLDEQVVAAAMQADTARFAWAEVNFMSEIPSGPTADPYRTWKWGSDDPTGYINQSAFAQIGLPAVQGILSGTGVTIAVLDTGVDATHPVFAGRLVPGRDLIHFDDIPQDGPEPGQPGGIAQGHGTHVSGVITHIAPEGKIMPMRILNVDGRGNTFILAYAIEWAANNGADVINMSLGTDCSSKVLAESVADAQAKGVVMVAAAGNGNLDAPQCPAGNPGVLSVTAVDDADKKADFANYGADWIDLAAPGVGITSTVPVSGSILYGTWSGTSMATPFASGAAALLRQRLPGAQPQEIADILVGTGTNLDPYNPDYQGKLGHLLNLGSAAYPMKVYLPGVIGK